ncbi:hypothetical protein [Mycobacteroides chelonae]|uniref:hypothetical protein n=1 Tax=Mycobacteroides chelonae TaxID=1774 RepID=UPI000994028F|nr:hypothetical protein [Mycobacteroides chelonae]
MSDDLSPGRRRAGVWLWVVALIAAAAVLAVAISGRDQGAGPTLRPMSASESMLDEQARAIAESTVLVWVREQKAGHLANLRALTNPENADHIMQVMDGRDEVVAFGEFVRRGRLWSLNTHLKGGAAGVFVLEVKDGELRVDRLVSAPIP